MCSDGHSCRPSTCNCRGGKIERFIEPCVLLLLKQKQPTHGYNLIEDLSLFGIEKDPGALYRTLRRLEDDNMVTSSWDTTGTGPAKRLYQLTDSGQELLKAWITNLKDKKKLLSRFIKFYTELTEG